MSSEADERKRCADIVRREIDIFDQVIGDRNGSGIPVLVVLQAQRQVLRDVWTKIMTHENPT
jgi:hypothetical protein